MRPASFGALWTTVVLVAISGVTTLAFGVDWTISHRFAIIGASVGWGTSVAIRRRRRRGA
ncbi:hypothetical protein [Halobacterium rubrum]|uniref:hypothetical protein n=1 Tax=Halobacterium TaxID=2239 RepID=UPI001F31B2A1|nr:MULTISPECIES: hypothetical protein [Halobacterium]MDH5019303.1 hypothetical protein [Halobacterium rubrum]